MYQIIFSSNNLKYIFVVDIQIDLNENDDNGDTDKVNEERVWIKNINDLKERYYYLGLRVNEVDGDTDDGVNYTY